METILQLTYLYLLVILLSLLIERVMEVIMAVWNYFELKWHSHLYWNRRAQRLMNAFSGEVTEQLKSSNLIVYGLKRRIRQYTQTNQDVVAGQTIVFSSYEVRKRFVRTVALIITSILGVLLCYFADINFVQLIQRSLEPNTIPLLSALGHPVQLVVSGLIIGLGAEPVHRIIKGLEDSRIWIEQRNQLNDKLIDVAQASIRKG